MAAQERCFPALVSNTCCSIVRICDFCFLSRWQNPRSSSLPPTQTSSTSSCSHVFNRQNSNLGSHCHLPQAVPQHQQQQQQCGHLHNTPQRYRLRKALSTIFMGDLALPFINSISMWLGVCVYNILTLNCKLFSNSGIWLKGNGPLLKPCFSKDSSTYVTLSRWGKLFLPLGSHSIFFVTYELVQKA